ncbi:MAG: 16S rRNA (cytosine(967)-C(5))-methyltransferase RsmB [Gammaproteobacteria bacterium]|nr:16S rRNA (cytosine(967)-C(5))-methyltransferase RsmB [Gammaproteobacteria bacterium]
MRALVADVLHDIIVNGNSLDHALEQARSCAANSNVAFLQESVYGVLRNYYALCSTLDGLLKRAIKPRDAPLKMLILAGLNELLNMTTAPYAAVDQSVAACDALGRRWAKGLVNGILRATLRQTSNALTRVTSDEIKWNHPAWLISDLARDWPQQYPAILIANNQHAPLTLRVNRLRGSREGYLELLCRAGIAATPTLIAPMGIHLVKPHSVFELPGFEAGLFSVQDEAAQLAAPLLDCHPGQRVLDACAAPGGKATHLLEQAPDIELTALDCDPKRQQLLAANLVRLRLSCAVMVGDAAQIANHPAHGNYERILLDAPCSATGVIRRHPDIKMHRRPRDISEFQVRQLSLLSAAWSCLVPDGQLLYATCSVLAAENDRVIEQFMTANSQSAQSVSISEEWGIGTQFGRQILPGEHAMDGFYYALLRKAGTAVSSS